MGNPIVVEWLGSVPYGVALARQEQAVAACRAGRSPDRLLLLEHPAVITLGRGSQPQNLRTSEAQLATRGIAVHRVPRGGDVTWHGPGQLVGYPILHLERRGEKDVVAYLRRLEQALIAALSGLGLAVRPVAGKTGVYMADAQQPLRKIASIGVGVKRWVTWHGFALNVTNDPAGFDDIVPCGLHGVEMTSVAQELGGLPERKLFDATRARVAEAFLESFCG